MASQRTIGRELVRLIYLFLFFSVIGWIYEVALAFLYGYGYVNRGVLTGPYLPLYGFGALIFIVCLERLTKKPLRVGKVSLTPLVVFLLIVLIATAIEYIAAVVLDKCFDLVLWNYSNYFLNFQGRVCFSASLRFGLGGMVFLYLLTPLFTGWVERIPPRARNRIAAVIVLVLVVDTVLGIAFPSDTTPVVPVAK